MAQATTDEKADKIDAPAQTASTGTFRHIISDDADSKYKVEKDRYHLYYSTACPWCHRVVITILLKGLEDVISMSDVEPLLVNQGSKDPNAPYIGWEFNEKYPDPNHKDFKSVWDIYKLYDKNYGNKSLPVPILFDKKTNTIVSNESGDIIVFLNSNFEKLSKYKDKDNDSMDLNPIKLKDFMDKWDKKILPNVNIGVYKCGFAESQEDYDKHMKNLFDTMDEIEVQLGKQRYLISGDCITLSDVRLFVTLIRFDVVYYVHYKCNKKSIQYNYPNIFGWLKDIYQTRKIGEKSCDFDYIKYHYFKSQRTINPNGVIPTGPIVDYSSKHNRDTVGQK